MKYAILDPTTETARLVDAEIFEGLDVIGMTVIELSNAASWAGKTVDWASLQIVDDIPQLRADQWERVKEIRDRTLLLAPLTGIGVVQSDPVSLGRISGLVIDALIAKGNNETFLETFTLADNREIEMNADAMIAFGRAVAAHVKATMARGRDLRHAIEAASTAAEVAALDVEAGW